MIPLGITTLESNQERKRLKQKVRSLFLLFGASTLLPFLVYALFAFGLVDAKPRFNPNIEMPVALVDAGGATGTAFLVGETRLLTANHVVEGMKIGDEVALNFQYAEPNIVTTARVLWKAGGKDSTKAQLMKDVAILELTRPTDLPEDYPRLQIGESESIVNRDNVIAIGYPAGLPSITKGSISDDMFQDMPVFQLEIGVWHGSSGGPLLLEETDEVIGIIVAGFSDEYQGINLALKISTARGLFEAEGINLEE